MTEQPTLPGMEQWAPHLSASRQLASHVDTGLAGRLAKRRAVHEMWTQRPERDRDEFRGNETYVRTMGMRWNANQAVPRDADFHTSSPSVWRRVGTKAEVPVIGPDAPVTRQDTVSNSRLKSMLERSSY